jgi:hypothetical protein
MGCGRSVNFAPDEGGIRKEEPMPNLKWLDGYASQSVDQLLSLEGQFRIDSLVLAFAEAIGQKAAREGMELLTDEERIILAVEALEGEVNNGGYGQFFFNSSREYAPFIVESLRRIGCPRTAEVTRRALEALQLPNLTVEAIQKVMAEKSEERDKALELCDALYFKRPEDIESQLFAFIKKNKGKIRF